MFKEIELEGKGWARGRNGYFVPRRLDCLKDTKGMINLSVSSCRMGQNPISLSLTQLEALRLGKALYAQVVNQKEIQVVVVVEGGNIQSIFTNQPNVHFVKVDYDVDGTPREELKRVLQAGDGDRKSYELASVRHWGEAEVSPKETDRFFRNAMD